MGSLYVSQPYWPLLPVTGIVLLYTCGVMGQRAESLNVTFRRRRKTLLVYAVLYVPCH
jgi:hypothetical protein